MVKIFSFITFSLLVIFKITVACNSDCLKCHIKIPEDKEHRPVNGCINCHKNHKIDVVNQCGADCFDCHSYSKVMKMTNEHKIIKRCSECHKNLKKKENFNLPLVFPDNPIFNSPFKIK